MKRLLIAPLLISLVGCSYQSSFEAKQACDKWAAKGKVYKWKKDIDINEVSKMYDLGLVKDSGNKWEEELVEGVTRYCTNDALAKKYLGFEFKKLNDKKTYKEYEIKQIPAAELTKRFAY